MASSTYKIICVAGEPTRLEGKADVAITPGELLRMEAAEELEPHGSAAGVLAGKLIALESPHVDSESTPAIDADYAIGDTVYYAAAKPGEVYNMWLKDGETAVRGVTQLVSDGAGALQAETVDATTLENSVVGVPAEDKVASGARARVLVRIT